MRQLTRFLAIGAAILALGGSAHAATLTITNNGTNPGATSVTPTGQVCNVFNGGTCTFTVTNGTTITLAANSPTTPGTFNSGTGDAAGCGTSTCTFTINNDSSITATFNQGSYPSVTVALAGTGKGDVGMNAGRCQNFEVGFSACTQFYAPGSVVTLQGRSVVANNFTGYTNGSGDAAGCSSTPCSFTLNGNATVTANFAALSFISVTPPTATIDINQQQPYSAIGTFTNGSTRPLSGTNSLWSQRQNLLSARFGNAAVTLNGRIYSLGGTPFGGPPMANVDEYQAATGPFGQNQTWTPKAPLPSARENLAAAVINGQIYVVGGTVPGPAATASLLVSDLNVNSWTAKAPMPTPRSGLSAAALNGILYVAGGGNFNGGSSTTFEAYDPATDTWTTLAPMSTPRRNAAMVAVEGAILVIAGDTTNMAVEAYNPATDTWSPRASLPQLRQGSGAAVVAGLTYLVGGFGGNALVYNSVNNAWTGVGGSAMPTTRGQMGVTAFDGRIWVVGGLAQTAPNTFNASNAMHALRPAEVHFAAGVPAVANIGPGGVAFGVSYGQTDIRARAGSVTSGLGGGNSGMLTVAAPVTECAIVQFSLAPGSAVFGQVMIEMFDPQTGNVIDPASPAPIGVEFEVEPGVYGLRFIAPAGYTVSPSQLVQTVNCDDNINIALNFQLIDTTAPSVTATAAGVLWPPNGKMVPVTVSGTLSDAGSGIDASSATFTVVDEYGVVQPSGAVTVAPNGSYSFTVQLESSRKGTDKDGRTYTVVVSVEDNNGNVGSATTSVAVAHDQRK